MPRKRAAPGDKAVLPPRTPADLVSIMSGNRAIHNSFVSYLGQRDIARLRLVSKALSKLFPVTHFLEHVVGTKRLAALSPLPTLEQPLIRTDSTITEGGRYMSTGNFPRVPSRIVGHITIDDLFLFFLTYCLLAYSLLSYARIRGHDQGNAY